MLTSIKQIIPLVARRLKLERKLEIDEIIALWPKVIEEAGVKGNKVRPLFLKEKTLFINCPNPIWANELQMRQKNIIKEINRLLGKEKIERMNFVF